MRRPVLRCGPSDVRDRLPCLACYRASLSREPRPHRDQERSETFRRPHKSDLTLLRPPRLSPSRLSSPSDTPRISQPASPTSLRSLPESARRQPPGSSVRTWRKSGSPSGAESRTASRGREGRFERRWINGTLRGRRSARRIPTLNGSPPAEGASGEPRVGHPEHVTRIQHSTAVRRRSPLELRRQRTGRGREWAALILRERLSAGEPKGSEGEPLSTLPGRL